jgi:chitin disaccharide deacetylase
MESRQPLLIVNADDLGYNQPATDAIAESFRAGRITSATAMVYMRDSDRAAEIAREIGLPVGLHINFTEPFDDPDVPADLRARHLEMVRRFGGPSFVYRSRRWLYDRKLREPVGRCIAEQLERFEAIYGGPPTHVDGHMHVHVCPNVGLSSAIPAGMKMRNSLGMPPLAGGAMARLTKARQRIILRKRLSTAYFLNITDLHPEFVEGGVRSRLGLAEQASVELMAHPGFCHEYTMLMAPEWEEWTAGLRLGSYRDLA